jgi:hypothetical protein
VKFGQSMRSILVDDTVEAINRSICFDAREKIDRVTRHLLPDIATLDEEYFAHIGVARTIRESILKSVEGVVLKEQADSALAVEKQMRALVASSTSAFQLPSAFRDLDTNGLRTINDDLKWALGSTEQLDILRGINSPSENFRDIFKLDRSAEQSLSIEISQKEALSRLLGDATGLHRFEDANFVKPQSVGDALNSLRTITPTDFAALRNHTERTAETKSASFSSERDATRLNPEKATVAAPITKPLPLLRVVRNEQYNEHRAPHRSKGKNRTDPRDEVLLTVQSVARETASLVANHLQLPSRGGCFVFRCSSGQLHGAKIIRWCDRGNGMVRLDVELDRKRFTLLVPRMAIELRARYEVALTDE